MRIEQELYRIHQNAKIISNTLPLVLPILTEEERKEASQILNEIKEMCDNIRGR